MSYYFCLFSRPFDASDFGRHLLATGSRRTREQRSTKLFPCAFHFMRDSIALLKMIGEK